MPEEWLHHAKPSNVDVLCFICVTCGSGKVSTSLGSCCWALTVVFSWIGGLQLAWLRFPTPPDLRANSYSFSPWFPLYCLSSICDAQLVRCLLDWPGCLGSWDEIQRHKWYRKSGLMFCHSFFVFNSCICDFGVGGDTTALFCRENSWEAHILSICEAGTASAICIMGRWCDAWWGSLEMALHCQGQSSKPWEICGCAKFIHIPPGTHHHAGDKPLTRQRGNLISGCPGCQYWRCAQHVFLDPTAKV